MNSTFSSLDTDSQLERSLGFLTESIILCIKSFQCHSGCKPRVIVLLKGEPLPQFQEELAHNWLDPSRS